MLLRNAGTAAKNANCTEFTDLTTITSTVIPFFHKRKHKTPLLDKDAEEEVSVTSLPTYCSTSQDILYQNW
jgi:hypothetical protein